jgi:hypothetical protein
MVRVRLLVANGRLPSDHRVANHPITVACRRLASVKDKPSAAKQAPSLTVAARDGDGEMAVGMEECWWRGSNERMSNKARKKCTSP